MAKSVKKSKAQVEANRLYPNKQLINSKLRKAFLQGVSFSEQTNTESATGFAVWTSFSGWVYKLLDEQWIRCLKEDGQITEYTKTTEELYELYKQRSALSKNNTRGSNRKESMG